MSMFVHVRDRDFAFELDGNSYFYDDDGYGVELGCFCYDVISKDEFAKAQRQYCINNDYPIDTEIYYGKPWKL